VEGLRKSGCGINKNKSISYIFHEKKYCSNGGRNMVKAPKRLVGYDFSKVDREGSWQNEDCLQRVEISTLFP